MDSFALLSITYFLGAFFRMSAQYMPKTLAKTLTYILVHAPHEYGLFWNADGTMPWKELYWTLQEDASLRYVREMHLREIAFLGIEFPVELDGNVLRLKKENFIPVYPPAEDLPERLYYGCRRKQYLHASQNGLSSSNRPFLPLAKEKDLALRLAHRRDSEPILLEIFSRKAALEGISFFKAGPTLFLGKHIPREYLLFPPVREDLLLKLSATGKPDKKLQKKMQSTPTPGSFLMDINHLQGIDGEGRSQGKGGVKSRRGAEWKRASRKERTKRNV